jgi:hypothetical protein
MPETQAIRQVPGLKRISEADDEDKEDDEGYSE